MHCHSISAVVFFLSLFHSYSYNYDSLNFTTFTVVVTKIMIPLLLVISPTHLVDSYHESPCKAISVSVCYFKPSVFTVLC